MAKGLYMVSVANAANPNVTIVDGIHAVLINSDDGGTNATIIAEAEAQVVAAGHDIPSGYFDTVTDIDDLTSGPLKDDEDTMIILPRGTETVQGS